MNGLHAMKLRSTTVRVVAALAIVLLLFTAVPVRAAISLQSAWATIYSGAAFPGTYSYTVAAGANRMLVVGVSSSLSATPGATQTATVTYGGQNLTQVVGDGATSKHNAHLSVLFTG